MSDVIARQVTRDAVLAALREAERPLTVSEVRQRVRYGAGLVMHRSTIASALKRLLTQSAAGYDVGEDGQTQMWWAIPEAL